jgi:hypothetical protein
MFREDPFQGRKELRCQIGHGKVQDLYFGDKDDVHGLLELRLVPAK